MPVRVTHLQQVCTPWTSLSFQIMFPSIHTSSNKQVSESYLFVAWINFHNPFSLRALERILEWKTIKPFLASITNYSPRNACDREHLFWSVALVIQTTTRHAQPAKSQASAWSILSWSVPGISIPDGQNLTRETMKRRKLTQFVEAGVWDHRVEYQRAQFFQSFWGVDRNHLFKVALRTS